jgi:hypothetical protein
LIKVFYLSVSVVKRFNRTAPSFLPFRQWAAQAMVGFFSTKPTFFFVNEKKCVSLHPISRDEKLVP